MPTLPRKVFDPSHHTTTIPRNVTTLHASGQGYTDIDPSIRLFVNLEVLWLDHNQLNDSTITEIIAADDSTNSSNLTNTFLNSTLPKSNFHSKIGTPDTNQTFSSTVMHANTLSDSTSQHGTNIFSQSKKKLRPPLDDQNHAKGTIRLKELYLHYNRLQTLPESLIQLKFLKILLLHNNQLRDLDRILGVLKKFLFLEHLDLFDNPLSEEAHYRERVLTQVTSTLRIFDRHAVTDLERIEARDKLKKVKGFQHNSKKNNPTVTFTSPSDIENGVKTFTSTLNTTKKPNVKDKEAKIVFGKTVRVKDLLPPPKAQEITPTLAALNKEVEAIKDKLKLEDPYQLNKLQTISDQELLKNTLRFNGKVHQADSKKEYQVVPVRFIDQDLPPGLLTPTQKELLLNFNDTPIHALQTHFPTISNFVTFDAFFLELCQVEAKKYFDLIKEYRSTQPIESPKKEELPESNKNKGNATKGKAAENTKGKPQKGGKETLSEEPSDDKKIDISAYLSLGTAWETARLDFLEFCKKEKQKLALKESRSTKRRGDSFGSVYL